MDALDFIYKNRLVSIARQVYDEALTEAARAVCRNGIRMLEVTFDQAAPDCIDLTCRSIRAVKAALGDEMLVGAGTVMTEEQARAAKDAGADFALAPNVDPAVIIELKKLGLTAVPGAMTPTEIAQAYEFGADIVKIFPAASLGLDYLKAIRGPLNHIPLMAVGGISAANVADFLRGGCCSAGIGGNVISKKLADAGDFEAMGRAAAALVAALS